MNTHGNILETKNMPWVNVYVRQKCNGKARDLRNSDPTVSLSQPAYYPWKAASSIILLLQVNLQERELWGGLGVDEMTILECTLKR